jgi:hypothetical protein
MTCREDDCCAPPQTLNSPSGLTVLTVFSALYADAMLFQPRQEELSDEEIAAILRQTIAAAGRLPRHADVFLASI